MPLLRPVSQLQHGHGSIPRGPTKAAPQSGDQDLTFPSCLPPLLGNEYPEPDVPNKADI